MSWCACSCAGTASCWNRRCTGAVAASPARTCSTRTPKRLGDGTHSRRPAVLHRPQHHDYALGDPESEGPSPGPSPGSSPGSSSQTSPGPSSQTSTSPSATTSSTARKKHVVGCSSLASSAPCHRRAARMHNQVGTSRLLLLEETRCVSRKSSAGWSRSCQPPWRRRRSSADSDSNGGQYLPGSF